jgi:hypothetical protein
MMDGETLEVEGGSVEGECGIGDEADTIFGSSILRGDVGECDFVEEIT